MLVLPCELAFVTEDKLRNENSNIQTYVTEQLVKLASSVMFDSSSIVVVNESVTNKFVLTNQCTSCEVYVF